MDDLPVIYGLEDFQSRTLVAQAAETEKINFLVGTQSLRNVNQVQLIEFDDDTGLVSKQHFEHAAGEIWSLASSPQTPNIIATAYYHTQDYHTECGASVWKFPVDQSASSANESGGASLTKLCDVVDTEEAEKEFRVQSLAWAPEDESQMIALIDNRVVVWDLKEAGKEAKVVGQTSVEGKGSLHLGVVRWCPHQKATQAATTLGSSVISYDMRTMKPAWTVENTHSPIVRDVDFNPNKQYYLATCGDDASTKFWDVRNTTKPLLTRSDHSHWVWSVRFNASYDQLVLTCSSDQRVILSNLPSVASQPIGAYPDEEENTHSREKEESQEDGVLHSYEDHEESVYAVEWSSADFWTFASISFDGRLVINKVPKSFKYKQFM